MSEVDDDDDEEDEEEEEGEDVIHSGCRGGRIDGSDDDGVILLI